MKFLDCNSISDEGAKAIGNAVKDNNLITGLYIGILIINIIYRWK